MDVLAWLFNFWMGLLLIDHCDLSSRHDLQNNQVWHSRGLIDSSNNQATLARIHVQGLTLNQKHRIFSVYFGPWKEIAMFEISISVTLLMKQLKRSSPPYSRKT